MAHKDELGKDSEGRFRRYIGWKAGDEKPIQHLFRLGKDEQRANAAKLRLERLWDAVVARWKRLRSEGRSDDALPLWDTFTLVIGQAIAKGENVCALTPPPEVQSMPVEMQVAWLGRMQADFPVIGLALDQPDVFAQGADGIRAVIQVKKEILSTLNEPLSTQTIQQALEAYSKYIEEKYNDKPSNRPQQLSITLLKRHTDDFVLSKLDADKIETWLAYWCRRPLSKDAGKRAGRTLAYTTCRNLLIVLRQFLRWLARSPQFDWQMPSGFSFPRCKIVKTAADRVKKRRHFTRDELKIIWQYAKPWERALILLALNCGFSKAEIATLQPSEIVQGKKHTYIKRDRRKTDVYGEWVLWPETLQALEYLKQFQRPDSVFVVLNTAGGPLTRGTKKGNENQTIKNHWDNLFKRLKEDDKKVDKLPFKHLRKTGANFIRHMKVASAAELSVMYLSHGEKSDGNDQLLHAYTDRPWRKLHKVLFRLRKYLLPVITSEPNPWESQMNRVSPAKRARIKELRAAGKTMKVIGEEVGLHEVTVGKICRREEAAKSPR